MGRKRKRSWKVLTDYVDAPEYAGIDTDIPAEPEFQSAQDAAHPEEIPASFYDEEYFNAGTKSNYKPYSPDIWARKLARMIHEHTNARSVIDVGCAYGYIVAVLRERGVEAYGFDVSEYAIRQSVAPAYTWVGSADDRGSYRLDAVDLIVSTEMLEHLSERQIRMFLENAKVAKEMVLLFGVDGGKEMNEDGGHVTFHAKEWWERIFVDHGWSIEDASGLNGAAISQSMGWSGRFFVLSRNDSN